MSELSSALSTSLTRDKPIESRSTARWWYTPLVYLAAVELAILYAPTLRWLFERWTLSVWQHAHGLLIPPVVGYFVYQELRPLARRPREASAFKSSSGRRARSGASRI